MNWLALLPAAIKVILKIIGIYVAREEAKIAKIKRIKKDFDEGVKRRDPSRITATFNRINRM